MDHRPKCEIQNYKTSEDNIEENLDNLEYDLDFLEEWLMKEINDMMDFIKVKKYCKRQWKENDKTNHRLRKNISKRHIDEKLLSKIYKELLKFSNKTNNLTKIWAKDLSR